MKNPDFLQHKIFHLPALIRQVAVWKFLGKKIAFTNGCFDILHQGHISSLSFAAKEADILIVGLNSDDSVRKLKGAGRPINDQHSRGILLASLVMVDAIVIFEEDTPRQLIKALMPDVLVKGGDYTTDQIAGAQEVVENGGRVVINSILEGFSTSNIIEKIRV